MRSHRKLGIAICLGVGLSMLFAHAAAASTSIALTIDERGTRGPLTFSGSVVVRATVPVTCNVTLRGELTALSVPVTAAGRLPEGVIASITEGRSDRRCTDSLGGRADNLTILNTSARPARVRYDGILGTLPTILGVTVTLLEVELRVDVSGVLPSRCLYRGTGGGLFFEAEERRSFNRFRFNELAAIAFSSGEALCAREATLSGTLTLSPQVRVRLSNGESPAGPWVVSLGDSIASGEGSRWAGNTASNNEEELVDALGATAYFDEPRGEREEVSECHRSSAAAIRIGGTVRSKDLACSGATVSQLRSQAEEALRRFAEEHDEIQLVAVSIGANDFDIFESVRTCVIQYNTGGAACSTRGEVTRTIEASAVRANTLAIAEGLLEVVAAMASAGYPSTAYHVLIQNYPSLVPARGGFRYAEVRGGVRERHTIGGCEVYDVDADWFNREALPEVNRAVRDAVARTRLANTVELDISTAFEGRRLCETGVGTIEEKRLRDWTVAGASDETEWVHASSSGAIAHPEYALAESFHPDYWGQLALRNCVRQAYNSNAPRGGRCVRNGTGLDVQGEPNMRL